MKHHQPQRSWRLRTLCALALVCAAASVGGTGARATAGAACSSSADPPYSVQLTALTGAGGADLKVAVVADAASQCAAPEALKTIQLKTFDPAQRFAWVRSIENVPAPGGVANLDLGLIPRDRRIDAEVVVETGSPNQTVVLRSTTKTLLRPDLVVQEITPKQALVGTTFSVNAVISERNGDVGASADVTLSAVPGAFQHVDVPRGGSTTVSFPVSFASAVPVELTAAVSGVAPTETDVTNNALTATVEITKNQLAPSVLLVQSLGGYGFQFNQHVYAPITNPPPETLPDLESKVKALGPQLVRIFYNENWEANANGNFPEWQQNLDSFRRTVQLAQDAGATVVIDYQTIATAKTNPVTWMTRFAAVLQDLVQNRGLTSVRWVTVANEPNSTTLTLAQYEALNRALDAQLVARGLSSQIGLIGGDLVQNTEGTAGGHRAWFDYMVTHMNDVFDAWSEHIYWRYDQTWRMEERLKDVAHLVHDELPAAAQKPTLLMEYGVRGFDTCGTQPLVKFAYYADANCTQLRRMPLAGFHKLWFSINSAQLGFDGASDWDLYWGVYDRTNPPNQSFWTIGPPEEGWALYPSYYALRLLLQTTERGWQVLGVEPWTADDAAARFDELTRDTPEQELAAYQGPGGQLTLIGLDTNGGALTAPNGESSSYSIGGLPPSTTFTLALWNATGDGTNSIAGPVITNAAGVARFDVPLQAAFALTTVPVS